MAFIDHALTGDDAGAVAVVDLAGRKRTVSSQFSTAQGLAWSADGKEIWLARGVKREREVVLRYE